MRRIFLPVKSLGKAKLIGCMNALTGFGFVPVSYDGVQLVFGKECDADEWYDVYIALRDRFGL